MLTKWIAELNKNLRLGTTDSGEKISPQLAEQIRLHRDRLGERRDALRSGNIERPTIGEIHDKIAERFVLTGFYGKPQRGQDAELTSTKN